MRWHFNFKQEHDKFHAQLSIIHFDNLRTWPQDYKTEHEIYPAHSSKRVLKRQRCLILRSTTVRTVRHNNVLVNVLKYPIVGILTFISAEHTLLKCLQCAE